MTSTLLSRARSKSNGARASLAPFGLSRVRPVDRRQRGYPGVQYPVAVGIVQLDQSTWQPGRRREAGPVGESCHRDTNSSRLFVTSMLGHWEHRVERARAVATARRRGIRRGRMNRQRGTDSGPSAGCPPFPSVSRTPNRRSSTARSAGRRPAMIPASTVAASTAAAAPTDSPAGTSGPPGRPQQQLHVDEGADDAEQPGVQVGDPAQHADHQRVQLAQPISANALHAATTAALVMPNTAGSSRRRTPGRPGQSPPQVPVATPHRWPWPAWTATRARPPPGCCARAGCPAGSAAAG